MLERVARGAEDRIAAIVAEVLAKRGMDGPIAADAELARFGMTSIDMVELMLGVEAEFDVTIPPTDITLTNFSSIAAMTALVERLRSGD